MDTTLESQSLPITLPGGFIVKEEASIIMQCHDRIFKSITVLGETGEKLFTVESKGLGSLTWRRTVRDISGDQIFDLLHLGFAMKNKWVVESPGGGNEIASLKHVKFLGKARSALDVVIRTAENDNGKEKIVEVRPNDRSAITTMVNIDGAHVAVIQIVESNDVVNLEGFNRSIWKARVASGVDLALVGPNVPTGEISLTCRPRFWWSCSAVRRCITFGGSELLVLKVSGYLFKCIVSHS